MKPLNKNLAYDCSNLSEEEMSVLSKRLKFMGQPSLIYYDTFYKSWLHVTDIDGTHITNFTDAKTLFND